MPWKVHFFSFTLMEPGFDMKILFFNDDYKSSISFFLYMHDENFVLCCIFMSTRK